MYSPSLHTLGTLEYGYLGYVQDQKVHNYLARAWALNGTRYLDREPEQPWRISGGTQNSAEPCFRLRKSTFIENLLEQNNSNGSTGRLDWHPSPHPKTSLPGILTHRNLVLSRTLRTGTEGQRNGGKNRGGKTKVEASSDGTEVVAT